ncbi:putative F-box protein At3g10240 [Bidens hawaiensis]|uniref:putative F-box protein At3g10240 n=1 Tax=Bidens hawaiensis TaxID=980011 RepID=UPI00404AFE62
MVLTPPPLFQIANPIRRRKSIMFPSEIIDNILSRLPVKSILKLSSVSKPWLSRISDPSFINLQLTHATTAFFIPAIDKPTRKLLIFSTNDHGGSLTHLGTIDGNYSLINQTEHVNGLVLLNVRNTDQYHCYEAIVVNPSTRSMIKIGNYEAYGNDYDMFFFGFDESTNEHKILRMCGAINASTPTLEIIVLSSSNYSWRKIDDATFDIGRKNLWFINIGSSVCVNSVIHIMLLGTVEILAFDLRNDTFSIHNVPLDERHFNLNGGYIRNNPYLMKINGCIGVVDFDRVLEANEINIWILQDYENHVWVKETVISPEPWGALGCPFPLDAFSTDEIIFPMRNSRNVISALIYNMKSRCFKSVNFTLDHLLLRSQSVCFNQSKCYLESIVPL